MATVTELMTQPKNPKSGVWQIRADRDWLARVKLAAKMKGLSAAAYLRMVAIERMDADGIPSAKAQKR